MTLVDIAVVSLVYCISAMEGKLLWMMLFQTKHQTENVELI